jgi:hypothetical protein
VVPTAVPRCGSEGRADDTVTGRGGEGRADDMVPGCFNVEEERGVDMEEEQGADAEDAEEERAPTGVCRGNDRVRV